MKHFKTKKKMKNLVITKRINATNYKQHDRHGGFRETF
nr:MAG TPA: hypothetical protein [Caudoviricetes sp.]